MQINKINNSTNFLGELSQIITIMQKNGIHIRPSGYIAKLLKLSDKDIFLYSKRIPSKKLNPSIMDILMLELHKGEKIELIADERYPKKLFEAIGQCFGAKDVEETQAISKKFIENYNKHHPTTL